jgi:sirohydrochlorin cobaltochelatase
MNPSIVSATIVFAHGSRDPQWALPVERIAQLVQRRTPQQPVVCAYLELTPPDLAQAVARMLASDPQINHLRILPVFLGMGRHAREDLPEQLRSLQAMHPNCQFELLASAGESDQVLEAIASLVHG